MTTVRSWQVEVSRRIDGTPWPIRFVEIDSGTPGHTTGFVAGLYGDKPLGVLALLALERRLTTEQFSGKVILAPAVNLPALEVGTRVSPDHWYLNRRFPGTPGGTLSDQIANRVLATLREHTDTVVDLHSGTPTMALGYTYDFGDPTFSASFGYLPVVVDHHLPGQLSLALAKDGGRSCLPEFAGAGHTQTTIGVEGCLNVLRYRGQLGGSVTGPRQLPLIREVKLLLPSVAGILQGSLGPLDLGKPVPAGTLGWVSAPSTGERLEELVVPQAGAILLMVVTTPTMVAPGSFGFMVGFPFDEIVVPGA